MRCNAQFFTSLIVVVAGVSTAPRAAAAANRIAVEEAEAFLRFALNKFLLTEAERAALEREVLNVGPREREALERRIRDGDPAFREAVEGHGTIPGHPGYPGPSGELGRDPVDFVGERVEDAGWPDRTPRTPKELREAFQSGTIYAPNGPLPDGMDRILWSRQKLKTATEVSTFLVRVGNMSNDSATSVAACFDYSVPVELVESREPTQFERFFGGTSKPGGRWLFSDTHSATPERLALPPKNKLQGMAFSSVDRGALFLRGRAAGLFGQPGGGVQYFSLNPEKLGVSATYLRATPGRTMVVVVVTAAGASAVTYLAMRGFTLPPHFSRRMGRELVRQFRELRRKRAEEGYSSGDR